MFSKLFLYDSQEVVFTSKSKVQLKRAFTNQTEPTDLTNELRMNCNLNVIDKLQ